MQHSLDRREKLNGPFLYFIALGFYWVLVFTECVK